MIITVDLSEIFQKVTEFLLFFLSSEQNILTIRQLCHNEHMLCYINSRYNRVRPYQKLNLQLIKHQTLLNLAFHYQNTKTEINLKYHKQRKQLHHRIHKNPFRTLKSKSNLYEHVPITNARKFQNLSLSLLPKSKKSTFRGEKQHRSIYQRQGRA